MTLEQNILIQNTQQTLNDIPLQLTIDSSLAASYAHAKTAYPSASALEIYNFIENLAQRGNPKNAQQLLLIKMYQQMLIEISTNYHFDDPSVATKIFPSVEKRRINGFEKVLSENPQVVIDLGCGCSSFLLDLLKTNTNITAIGLDFPKNIETSKAIVDQIFPEFKDNIHLQNLDFTKTRVVKAMFSILVKALQDKGKIGKLVFYNQGLFRYIPKNLHRELAQTIYDVAQTYPDEVSWVQSDNEIVTSGTDVSTLNGTGANIFYTEQDMLETFTLAGWKTKWDGQILILTK